ncbi:MAG: HAMP domain-containing histidine kinase [Proteobacteria bacterium]|nr:HAMP domain-containing histidine kinase [Pseudomonadota bacterium]
MPSKKPISSNIEPEQLNAVLMSFIHDIKNSLLVSLNGLDELYMAMERILPQQEDSFNQIQLQLRRINSDLVQLLSLYKMETKLFSLHADQYNCYDFFDELVINNAPLTKQAHFSFELDCDEDIDWFFDHDLIATVINSTINNSIRYTHSKILLCARINNGFLEITIEDDGDGFPKKMFVHHESLKTAIDMKSGSTGLGLYFAEQIANIHHSGDKKGHITIDNNSKLGGGRFTLFLP